MGTIILGLGNTILTDDGMGIYVVREIRRLISTEDKLSPHGGGSYRPRITIQEASIGGFNFLDVLAGYKRAVIIDAIHTKGGRPGEFYELDTNCLRPSVRISSLHSIDLATACDMAKKIGADFPDEMRIFVMEVKDEFSFGERCTPLVETAIIKMAEGVYGILKNDGWI